MQGAQVQFLVKELDPTFHNLRFHTPPQRSMILHAAMKTQPSQINISKIQLLSIFIFIQQSFIEPYYMRGTRIVPRFKDMNKLK